MRYLLYILILVVFGFGCSSISLKDQVFKDYKALDLGSALSITSDQAKIIAQKELIDRSLDLTFKLQEPKIAEGPKGAPDIDKYWFVKFKEKHRSAIPYILTVVIDKNTGKVRIVDDYPADKDWVLESALYGLKIQDR